MSMFTQCNGPQGGYPDVQQLTKLVTQYETIVQQLQHHIFDSAGNSDVHKVSWYVTEQLRDLESRLTASINSKAGSDFVATQYATKQDLARDLLAKHNELTALINKKLDTSIAQDVFFTKAQGEQMLENLTGLMNDITTFLTIIPEGYAINDDTTFKKDVTVKGTLHANALTVDIKATTAMNVKESIDFTDWSKFVGQQVVTETGETLAVVAMVANSWVDENDLPPPEEKNKNGMLYLKRGNTTTLAATILWSCSVAESGTTGAIQVISSGDDIECYLVYGTSGNQGDGKQIYICLKDLANTEYRVCGINIYAPNDSRFIRPNHSVHYITHCKSNGNTSSFNKITSLEVSSDKITDYENLPLFEVSQKEAGGETFKQLTVGNDKYKEITYYTRPQLAIQQGDTVSVSPFITANELQDIVLPIGAILRWGVDSNGNLIQPIPDGFLATDGSGFIVTECPELAELYPDGKLPVEVGSIIKAKKINMLDKVASPQNSTVLDFSIIESKIQRLEELMGIADTALQANIDVEKQINEQQDIRLSAIEPVVDNNVARLDLIEPAINDNANRISAVETGLVQEKGERAMADNGLQDQINAMGTVQIQNAISEAQAAARDAFDFKEAANTAARDAFDFKEAANTARTETQALVDTMPKNINDLYKNVRIYGMSKDTYDFSIGGDVVNVRFDIWTTGEIKRSQDESGSLRLSLTPPENFGSLEIPLGNQGTAVYDGWYYFFVPDIPGLYIKTILVSGVSEAYANNPSVHNYFAVSATNMGMATYPTGQITSEDDNGQTITLEDAAEIKGTLWRVTKNMSFGTLQGTSATEYPVKINDVALVLEPSASN